MWENQLGESSRQQAGRRITRTSVAEVMTTVNWAEQQQCWHLWECLTSDFSCCQAKISRYLQTVICMKFFPLASQCGTNLNNYSAFTYLQTWVQPWTHCPCSLIKVFSCPWNSCRSALSEFVFGFLPYPIVQLLTIYSESVPEYGSAKRKGAQTKMTVLYTGKKA